MPRQKYPEQEQPQQPSLPSQQPVILPPACQIDADLVLCLINAFNSFGVDKLNENVIKDLVLHLSQKAEISDAEMQFYVKVSANDQLKQYLQQKLVPGAGITFTVLNPGGIEQIQIDAAGGPAVDEKVKITALDTTADVLNAKVVAGAGIGLAVLNPGFNEQLQITNTVTPPSLQNILVNGTFLLDPDTGGNFTHVCGSGLLVPPPGGWRPQAPICCAQMPGWALYDWLWMGGGDQAESYVETGGGGNPPAVIGPNIGAIYVTALDPGGGFDFYQPLHIGGSKPYQGKKLSFRCAVLANSPVQIFISHDAGWVGGDTHPADGAWHVLQVQETIPDPDSYLAVGISLPVVDTIYIDACTCVAGDVFVTNLPFIAKPQVDDLLAINSMQCTIQDEFVIWGPPPGGGVSAYRHIVPLPVTLRGYPITDVNGVPMPWPPQVTAWPPFPAIPPGSAPFFPPGTWQALRELVSYSIDDAGGPAWAGIPLPWNFYVNLFLDARPI